MSQDETDRTGKPNENEVGTTPEPADVGEPSDDEPDVEAHRRHFEPSDDEPDVVAHRRHFGPPLIENASDPQRRTH